MTLPILQRKEHQALLMIVFAAMLARGWILFANPWMPGVIPAGAEILHNGKHLKLPWVSHPPESLKNSNP